MFIKRKQTNEKTKKKTKNLDEYLEENKIHGIGWILHIYF